MSTAILQFEALVPVAGMAPVELAIEPGETILVQVDEPARQVLLADLSMGETRPAAGRCLFLGQDWTGLGPDAAATLRGRIGRSFLHGGWVPWLSVADNILLPLAFHGGVDADALREEAAVLARRFGLPGLPLALPGRASEEELARAALVRAFLGRPALLVLESPLRGYRVPSALPPLLEMLAEMRGTACLWLTASPAVWADRSVPARARLRFTQAGLHATSSRMVAA